jgi:hypothetical protein
LEVETISFRKLWEELYGTCDNKCWWDATINFECCENYFENITTCDMQLWKICDMWDMQLLKSYDMWYATFKVMQHATNIFSKNENFELGATCNKKF